MTELRPGGRKPHSDVPAGSRREGCSDAGCSDAGMKLPCQRIRDEITFTDPDDQAPAP